MTSAVAPFALDAGLIDINHTAIPVSNALGDNTTSNGEIGSSNLSPERVQTRPLTIRLRNLNTNRLIDALVHTNALRNDSVVSFEPRGDYHLDGVPGYSSPITLSFLSPGGAKTGKALPTGNAIDMVEWRSGKTVRASLLDISNPGVFIDGRDMGWDPARTPEQLNADRDLMDKLEQIRRAGAKMMGLDPDTPSIPKVVMLFPPANDDVDITCQALSMEQAHKAVPMTLGLNLGTACMMEGTMANQLVKRTKRGQTAVIGHPSGKVEVGAEIAANGEIVSAKVVRTARCLMEGYVNVAPCDKMEMAG